MKKALVVGANGFIGKHLCDELLNSGYSVVAADRSFKSDHYSIEKNISREVLDVTKVNDFSDYLHGVDVVFYLVCTLLPQESNEKPILDIESNLIPVIRLLEAARINKKTRVVFASSGGTVYGLSQNAAMDENSPTEPKCSYGIVKLTIEKYMKLYQSLYGVKTVCLRISNPFGPGQDPNRPQGAVGVFLHKILADKPITIWGDGTIVRDYVFVIDVVKAFILAADYEGDSCIFNIGSGIGTSLNDLINLLFKITGKSVSVERLSNRGLDVKHNVLSIDLAQNVLGWEPTVSLLDGVELVCSSLKEDYSL